MGGGGGAGSGGGGAGGLVRGSYTVSPDTSYSVTIGSGGSASTGGNDRGNVGGDSIAFGSTAGGGGGGGRYQTTINGQNGRTSSAGSGVAVSARIGGGGGGAGASRLSATGGGGGSPGGSGGGGSAGGVENENYGGGGGGATSAGSSANPTAPRGTGGSGYTSSLTGITRIYAVGGNAINANPTNSNSTPGSGGDFDTAARSGRAGVFIVRYALDATAPTVTSVFVPTNGSYRAGDTLSFTVNTSEAVTVTGTPQIALTLGSTTRQASYASGSTSTALVFSYTVQAGDTDTDGIAVGTLAANSGTLKDIAGNNMNLTLNSVGSTSAVLVDAVAPTVTSVSVPTNGSYRAGDTLSFTVNTSEAVTVAGTPQIALTLGSTTRQATYASGSSTPTALVFSYDVQTGDNDADGIAVGTLATNGGTITDSVGNDLNLTLNSVGSTSAVLVDAVAPSVSSVTVPANGSYKAGDTLSFTVNTSEAVTVTGTPQIALTVGSTTRQATYASGSTSTALVFSYTVQTGDDDADGIAVGTLATNSGSLRDSVGNNMNLTLNSVGSTSAVLVDAVAPTVSSVSVPTNGSYKAGDTLSFTVNTSEAVTVTGTPQITLTVGSTTRQATYASGSTSSALVFSYTVQTGDDDADGIAVGTLAINSGTLKDSVGNDLNLTLNSVGDTSAVLVDTAAPTLAITTDDTALTAGETATITFTFSEAPVGFAWDGSTGDVTVGGGTLSAIAATGDAKVFTAVLTPTANSTTAATVTVASGSYTDTAGNTGGAGAMPATTVNTVVPGTPVLTTSTSSISSTTPTLTGTAPANATVKIYNGSTLINTVTADGTGAWTLNITSGQLAEGANVITTTATDSSGNVSPSSSPITLTLDTAAPSAPSITSGAGTSNDATPTFAGTAEPNSTVEVFVGGVSVGTAMADGTGAWTLTLSAGSVSDGANTITATATDAAGNASSASSAATLNLDTTAPATAAVTTGDSTTTTAAFTLEGTAEANATVRILVGSTEVGTATADGSGDWSYTFGSGELVDGANSVTVIVVDTAGNTSAASTAITITLESPPPVIVIVDPTIRGEKTNTGTLNNPVIMGNGSLSGGTLCGTIASAGSISDVKLCAGATVVGGSVSGDITGDDESPARIMATVKSGSSLSHVIIDKSAVLEPGVRLGAGVVLESLASVAPGTDLSSLTQSTSGGIDLTSTGLPGPDQSPLSLIERVRQLDVLRQPNASAEQEPTRGSLQIRLPGILVKAMPQRVVKLAPGTEEGIFYDEDGNIRLVVTGPIEIIAFPEFSEEFPIKRAVETYDSELSMDINNKGNFTINRVEAVEGADTAASQRFVGRPSVSAVNVSNEPTVNDEGWRVSPSPHLDNVDAVAFVREDDSGEFWEQQLINRPADWFGFKAALLGSPEVRTVVIDIEGVISIVFRGELVKAMANYAVELNAASNRPGRPLVFLSAGDRNDDGAEDYYVYYPDGSRQLIYLLP